MMMLATSRGLEELVGGGKYDDDMTFTSKLKQTHRRREEGEAEGEKKTQKGSSEYVHGR